MFRETTTTSRYSHRRKMWKTLYSRLVRRREDEGGRTTDNGVVGEAFA
jgi:hypothetical protein